MGVGKFTPEQQKAIETLDKSILVAAAAGSGKTAVLVQRIINIILEGKAEVDEMLVVTFTKAAAAEMRLKLAKALKERMRIDPSSKDRLKPQLSKLYRAYISTFDSFAVRLIREFFYEIDIEPNFKACDEVQSVLLQRQAVDELFEDGFENDNIIEGGSFREFLRLYSRERNEETFKNGLLEAYAKLRTIPDYFDWAYKKAEELNVSKENLSETGVGKAMLEDAVSALNEACDAACKIKELFESVGLEKMYENKLANEISMLATIREMLEDGLSEELLSALQSIEYITLRSTKDDKESYECIKDEVAGLRSVYKEAIKNWKSCYMMPSFDVRLSEMHASYAYTVYYLDLLRKFEEYYEGLKKENGLLDFSDMEHYAVSILKHQSAADILRKRFKFIFIDEYQDTNNIQEHLISRIARPDNVFKVGDVKQSIYRFRQAEPAIFERTYREYSDEAEGNAIAIDLNRNFRSNDHTIRYINRVFESVMEGYDDKAKLYTGLCEGMGYGDEYDLIPELHVLTYDAAEDEGFEAEADEADVQDGGADEEIVNISKEEAEFSYIAELVDGIIGTEFYDSAAKVVRKAEPRDIAILMRSVKHKGDLMTRTLRNRNIQAHINDDDDYFDTVEIGIAVSLLSSIDNMKRDVPLIATLHSEIFGWTAEELAIVRAEYEGSHRDPFWMSLNAYAESGSKEDIRSKAEETIAQLKDWRELSHMMPLEDFIWRVLVESGYYMYAGAMNGGDRRQANLRVLVDRARKYSEESICSLSSFLDFIGVMKSKGVKNGQASLLSKEDNVVRIMTIHNSKGLEYPFVIVGNLGNKFNTDSKGQKFSFDSELGVGLSYVSPDRAYWRSTLMQRAINNKNVREEFKEELRILYVAMTRARNKLIMVGTVKSLEKLREGSSRRNFLEVMRDSLNTEANEFYTRHVFADAAGKKFVGIKELLATRPSELKGSALDVYQEVSRRLGYEYPYSDMLDVASKYSVSAIRKDELAKEQAKLDADAGVGENGDEMVKLWKSSDHKKKSGAADAGIAYHRIMEFIDFGKACDKYGNVDSAYIRERAEFLKQHGAIDDGVFRALDLSKIEAFFRTPLGLRAAKAAAGGKIYKEKAFTLKTEHEGRNVLVQGVVDCCWEEDGEMVLVDYKSSYINPRKDYREEQERIRHEYRRQVEIYSEAVEKGLEKPVKEAYLYLFVSSDAIQI
ncbi:MAG: UvrD-helicase domain-containing protein [Clostridiales bacterium]|nr:UvrD-helicase domain-containing protein [Candidatus Crickella caballi]